MLILEYASATDTGHAREKNEDAVRVSAAQRVAVVCDGMGGHLDGAIAARLAADAVIDAITRAETELGASDERVATAREQLASAVRFANRCVFEHAASPHGPRRMGTTLVAAMFLDSHAIVANVGDSRCYRIRGHDMVQLTADHSMVEEARRQNPGMTAKDLVMLENAYRHVVTRALGLEAEVAVDIRVTDLEEHDVFVLCSDGIWGCVPDAQVAAIIARERSLSASCRQLIEAANQAGGPDNATVVLVRAARPIMTLPVPVVPLSMDSPRPESSPGTAEASDVG